MVRAPSREMVASAGNDRVEKLAALPAPSAMIPPAQFAVTAQEPPFGLFHVLLAANVLFRRTNCRGSKKRQQNSFEVMNLSRVEITALMIASRH